MLIPVHNGTAAEREAVIDDFLDHVLSRWEDCEHEKEAALAENDALAIENAKLRLEVAEQAKQLASMRAA
ncbi:MAG: hypothetical protein COB03_02195 [Alteromonas sp.]|nr:hypothetical protein [Halomonas sp.]PHS59673.1 MAG: hypothetical protein COB03_02195 [Alteromonas sp.]